MTGWDIGVFFGVSFIAAAVNAVAGGGTFLTFPLFILNGLSPLSANIMSTIALWPGTLASIHGYRSVRNVSHEFLFPFLMICLIGGIAGALLLLSTPEKVFTRMVPWLLLAATLIFTFGQRMTPFIQHHLHPDTKSRMLPYAGMATIALYGGYFGAGFGMLTLAMLQLMGFSNIHQMNAIKTLLTGSINAAAFVIFVLMASIDWGLAIVMILGAMAGGYLGARTSLKVAPQKIRLLVSTIGMVMTVYFFLHPAA